METPEKSAPARSKSAEIVTAKGIVARGRSVRVGRQNVLPGGEVELPATEIDRLRAHGFLVDPDAEPVKESNGPTFERA